MSNISIKMQKKLSIKIFISSKTGSEIRKEIEKNIKECYNDEDYIIEIINISSQNAYSIKEQIKQSLEQNDIFILLLDEVSDIQWLYFEYGMAFALDIPILIVYKEENIFNKYLLGVFEDFMRVEYNNTRTFCNNLDEFIKNKIFNEENKFRKLIINNFEPIKYFPLEKNLICNISKTSFEIEPYFLEIPQITYNNNGMFFNGRFYLKQFIEERITNILSFLFWFKIEENIQDRFSNKFAHKNEPIFLLTYGNLERKSNNNLGVYYGRPGVEVIGEADNGLRIFTYCTKKIASSHGLEACDSKEYYKDIEKSNWYFCLLEWQSGGKPTLHIYNEQSELKKIEGNYQINSNLAHNNFLTIGGGFPYSKMYITLNSEREPIFSVINTIEGNNSFYTNSKLHLKDCFAQKRIENQFDEEEWINLQPYKLPLIDDFRFIGYIRELMVFNKRLSQDEINIIWKETKKLL